MDKALGDWRPPRANGRPPVSAKEAAEAPSTALGVPFKHRKLVRMVYRSAPMQGGRASLWGLVPPTDMKAEEVDDATPKMLTRISKWQKGWS